MLARFLEYETRGTVGRIQKGWHKMFPDHQIEKMRESLGKTREALRMSALVFQWSLGDAKIDDSVGIGYTGLAAALDRMAKGRSVAGITKARTLEQGISDLSVTPIAPSTATPVSVSPRVVMAEAPEPMLSAPVLPALPPSQPVFSLDRDSAKDLLVRETRSDTRSDIKPLPELQRHPSLSTQSFSSLGLAGGRATLTAGSLERLHTTSHPRINSNASPMTDDTLIQEVDPLDTGSIKIVRIKADPFTMPRWTPRNTAGAHAANLKAALITAVQASNHNLVEQLLDRGVSPNTGPETHVLIEAVIHHDIESIRLLLLFGGDPNGRDGDGLTPLMAAVEQSFLDGATMLLKYGADPNMAAGPDLESPLAIAVLNNKTPFIHLLLTYGGDPSHNLPSGDTILIASIGKKTPKKLTDLLLDYGSDPDVKNREGKTPLFEAIDCGRVDIVNSLLEHGANPNLPGVSGFQV